MGNIRHMRTKGIVVVLAAAALLAGCTDSDSAPSQPEHKAPATNASSGPTDPGPKHSDRHDGRLTVTDIRIEGHEGFDRVVYELGGTGVPGWKVHYTDEPTQDGSGYPVDVAGPSALEVRITGSAYPFDSGVAPYEGPYPVTDPESGAVTGVFRSVVFEGVTQSFIGIDADRPGFSVNAESDPTRLVIDIATE